MPSSHPLRSGRRPAAMSRVTSTVTAAVLVLLLAACTDSSRTSAHDDGEPGETPSGWITGTGPSARTPATTEAPTAVEPALRNGRITSAERYLGAHPGHGWRSFDPVSETGLFVSGTGRHSGGPAALTVVGRSGPLARLGCTRDLRCSQDDWLAHGATLGPGADEVTVGSDDHTAQVIGHDGTSRRTIDLGATTAGGAEIAGLRWSADGSRLAVMTVSSLHRRVWLVDGDEGAPELAYTVREPFSILGSPQWSLDERSLLLEVRDPGRKYGADVVVLHLPPEGAATPASVRTLYRSNRHFDWFGNVAWSPDGTRIAVRTRNHVTEISAEDGRVITRDPPIEGWLIWPARKG